MWQFSGGMNNRAVTKGDQVYCHHINDPPVDNGSPGLKLARYPPTMPKLKTQISKLDGTVTEQEKNLCLHNDIDIQVYLQLERDDN